MKNDWTKMGAFALGMTLALLFAHCLPASAQTIPGCMQTDLQDLANNISAFAVTITSATPTYVPSTTIAFCDVTGDITTEDPGPNTVEFELGLPASFNKRFLLLGGGGFNGYIPAGVVDDGVSAGFATAYTDSGHESVFASNATLVALSALDGSWGLLQPGNKPNTAAQVDFSYRGVHASTVVAQSITTGYYSMTSSPTSYFDGCSTGGREALVEAQLFPDDYNGIVAGDPAISDPIAGFNWNDQALLSSSDAYLSNTAVAILDAAVTAACDGSDGVIDGLIEDPRLCKFDPASIECKGGATSNCLTAAQVATVKAIQAGARAEDGSQLYPGYTLSNPGGSDGWDEWITGFFQPQFGVANPWGSVPTTSLEVAPFQWSFQDQFMKYFVFNDPTYDSLTFDFNGSDVAMLEEVVAKYGGNGEDTDLSPFFSNGGKLIMYHGWSDPALTPFVSVNYYSAVAKTLGGGFKHLQNNARLFMVPGMHHCTGGPGPYNFDPLTPLIGWVEAGVAPDRIIGEVPAGPQTGRTFPLCPFPSLAVYQGGGVDDAANWVCKAHTNHRFGRGNSHKGHQHG